MEIRDRIKALRRVRAGDLRANPKNWRDHPPAQTEAMRAVLADVGWAGAALARETPEGLELIDGHLRADLDEDAEIPVLVLDVDEVEADKILATFDPIAGMAGQINGALGELLAGLEEAANENLAAILRQIGQEHGVQPPQFVPEGEEAQPRLDQVKTYHCPSCGHEFTT